jgi:hypothetical protein
VNVSRVNLGSARHLLPLFVVPAPRAASSRTGSSASLPSAHPLHAAAHLALISSTRAAIIGSTFPVPLPLPAASTGPCRHTSSPSHSIALPPPPSRYHNQIRRIVSVETLESRLSPARSLRSSPGGISWPLLTVRSSSYAPRPLDPRVSATSPTRPAHVPASDPLPGDAYVASDGELLLPRGGRGANLPHARGKGSWVCGQAKSRVNSLDSHRLAFAFYGKQKFRDD